MKTIKRVSVDEADPLMQRLEPVLKKFNQLVETYCLRLREPPYWFTERASVSLFSAAAWAAGWVGVEEYSTRKVLASRVDANEPVHRHGRCDLFIQAPDGISFAIEAKQVVARPSDLELATTLGLRAARHDAMQLFSTEATARVAVLFLVPTLPADALEQHAVQFDDWLKATTNALAGKRRANHAYVFPADMRDCLGPGRKGFWPGTVVIAQRVRRRRSSTVQALP